MVRTRMTVFTAAGMLLLLLLATGSACYASDEAAPSKDEPAGGEKDPMATAFVALAAALAVGMCALATGLAQGRIGAAGCGALAEKPETGGTVILLVAIPETMVILGFVIAVVMLFAT